ncbi:hypothetical protein [Halorubrum trueperi]|uniref:DUF4235 domain-containing protein n=1 Tax=Halorubrum trueperi TaxID=2004704 RepID=A0ABD5US94_9EURY
MKAFLLLVAGIVGLIEAVVPRAVVRAWTRVAYRNAGDAEPREWVHRVARAEGAVLVFVALVGLFRAATSTDGDRAADATLAGDGAAKEGAAEGVAGAA